MMRRPDGDKRLRVKDAFREDSGAGRVRMDGNIVKMLKLQNGDAIEIINPTSKARTAGILFPAKREDESMGIIRLDQFLRRNINVAIDDSVDVSKIEAASAEMLKLSALKESIYISPKSLGNVLENRVVTSGDILTFYNYNKRYDFIVIDFLPKATAVQIQSKTKFLFTKETHEELIERESTRVKYEDIGGLKDEIQKVRELVELPFKYPGLFNRIGINPPKGILLHGPPGTGKTLLARALASETKAHFITINGADIMSKFYGQSEENLRKLFEYAKKEAPSIIFIDNLNSIASTNVRDVEMRVLTCLISLLDGLNKFNKVIVIGATNKLDNLESSLLTGDRFSTIVNIGYPNEDARLEIFKIHAKRMPVEDNLDFKELAKKTEGFNGADIKGVCRKAALSALRTQVPQINSTPDNVNPELLEQIKITYKDFSIAIESMSKVVEIRSALEDQ